MIIWDLQVRRLRLGEYKLLLLAQEILRIANPIVQVSGSSAETLECLGSIWSVCTFGFLTTMALNKGRPLRWANSTRSHKIVENYEDLDNETKQLLPLRRLYWPL